MNEGWRGRGREPAQGVGAALRAGEGALLGRVARWALLLCIVLVGSSCRRGAEEGGARSAVPQGLPVERVQPEPTPDPGDHVVLPETPAGERAQWYVDVLRNEGRIENLDALQELLHASFLEQVPERQFVALTRYLASLLGHFSLEAVEGTSTPWQISVVLRGGDERPYRLIIGVLDLPERPIQTLLIQVAEDLEVAPLSTWDDLDAALVAWVQEAESTRAASYLAARMDASACVPLHAHRAGYYAPIGSTFKVWVLGAVAQRVEEGRASWEDPIVMEEHLYSIPPGRHLTLEPGQSTTWESAAEEMIRDSDNTATDHLMHAVGVGRVEAWIAQVMEEEGAARNRPLLTTRQMTVLKKYPSDELRLRWMGGSEDLRRAALESPELGWDVASARDAAMWQYPAHIWEIGWYASNEDLCRSFLRLRDQAQSSEHRERLLGILAANPGVELDRRAWPYAGFKGGSEPGVLNLSWMLLGRDGDWYFFSLSVNDTAEVLSNARFAGLARAALQLFGQALPEAEEPYP